MQKIFLTHYNTFIFLCILSSCGGSTSFIGGEAAQVSPIVSNASQNETDFATDSASIDSNTSSPEGSNLTSETEDEDSSSEEVQVPSTSISIDTPSDEAAKERVDSDFDGIYDDVDLCPQNYNPRQETNACSCTRSNSLVIISNLGSDETQRLQNSVNQVITDETLECLLLEGTFKIQSGITFSGNIIIDGQNKTRIVNNSDTSSSVFNFFTVNQNSNDAKLYIRNIILDGNNRVSITRGLHIQTASGTQNNIIAIEGTSITNHRGFDKAVVFLSINGTAQEIRIIGNTVSNNSSLFQERDVIGAGIALGTVQTQGTRIAIIDNDIANNTGQSKNYVYSSGLYVSLAYSSVADSVLIAHNRIIGNQVLESPNVYGGGLNIGAFGSDTKISLRNNIIQDNTIFGSEYARGAGGFFHATFGSIEFQENGISGNRAEGLKVVEGGGMCIVQPVSPEQIIIYENNSIINNFPDDIFYIK